MRAALRMGYLLQRRALPVRPTCHGTAQYSDCVFSNLAATAGLPATPLSSLGEEGVLPSGQHLEPGSAWDLFQHALELSGRGRGAAMLEVEPEAGARHARGHLPVFAPELVHEPEADG